MAVPGNSGYASWVMHVSSLQGPVAEDMPTDWMVVTPVDAVGDLSGSTAPSAQTGSTGSTGVEPAPVPVASAPEVPRSPNPFAPGEPAPSEAVGMPSSLLEDLLGADPGKAP